MGRFIDCGELRETNGEGFLLAMKNGTLRGDITVDGDMVKDGILNFPVKIKEVTGDFVCIDKRLTSLKGAPEKVGGDFSCYDNKLTNLEGAPKEVGRNFYCFGNQLTNLEGAPKEVGRNFYCSNNKLTSLEGAPQKVGGNFVCSNNTKRFTEEEVRAVCNVKGRVIV